MTPNAFQRLLRYNQAREYMEKRHNPDWWHISTHFGYYDHSRFINEFQRFSGMTPVQYLENVPRSAEASKIQEVEISVPHDLI